VGGYASTLHKKKITLICTNASYPSENPAAKMKQFVIYNSNVSIFPGKLETMLNLQTSTCTILLKC